MRRLLANQALFGSLLWIVLTAIYVVLSIIDTGPYDFSPWIIASLTFSVLWQVAGYIGRKLDLLVASYRTRNVTSMTIQSYPPTYPSSGTASTYLSPDDAVATMRRARAKLNEPGDPS